MPLLYLRVAVEVTKIKWCCLCPEVSICRWVLVFSANLSCLCLLETPPMPTLYLVKTNAIDDIESLLKMIISLCWNNFRCFTLRPKGYGLHRRSFILDMRWGKGSDLSGLLDRQLQLWNPEIPTCQNREPVVARSERSSWCFSFGDCTTCKIHDVPVMHRYQGKSCFFFRTAGQCVCLILLSENPFGKVCIKSRILRHNLKAKLLRKETEGSWQM